MSREALIIVDVQNDFCPGGTLAVPQGDKIIGYLNLISKLASDLRWVSIASRDWHPEVTMHFQKYGGLWPEHCIRETKGAQFHPQLLLYQAEIFSKGMNENEDAYSAFDAQCEGIQYRRYKGLRLEELLKGKDVRKVYIGGLATDYCVKATALDSVKKGFKTYLLTDAVAAVNIDLYDGERATEEMLREGVLLTTTNLVAEKYLGSWI